MPEDPAPNWWDQAPAIRELAAKISIDPDALSATIDRFNRYAADGVDPDFHRGTFYFEDFQHGGPSIEANLRPVEESPFYALPIYAGALGTDGGPRINEHGQVLSARGRVIPGLYAAGNTAAGVFGPTYPGGGVTIGPALTFGYLAGQAMAKEPPRDLPTRG